MDFLKKKNPKKNTNDLVPQTWIIEWLKMCKISEKV